MSDHTEYNDLCTTCNYQSLCTRRRNLIRPVWHCEEFDDYVPITRKSFVAGNPHPSALSQSVEYDSRFRGLCINCERREECPTAHQPGVVWNCSYYI
jgi:hypothetical protein